MGYKIKDSSQGSFVRLTEVKNKIACTNCGHYLIFCDKNGTLLIKTYASVFDIKEQEFVLKCGKCLQFNAITLKDIQEGKTSFKLII